MHASVARTVSLTLERASVRMRLCNCDDILMRLCNRCRARCDIDFDRCAMALRRTLGDPMVFSNASKKSESRSSLQTQHDAEVARVDSNARIRLRC